MTAQRHPRPAYPGKVAIRHAVDAAKAIGLDIGGIELSPDGTIRVLDRQCLTPLKEDDLFAEQMRKGLI